MMEYYFTKSENINLEKNEIVIDDFEFKHLVKVLRKKSGDKITLTDGKRNIYYCEITSIQKGKLLCQISGIEFNLYEPEVSVSLYLSLLRNFSRFEFAIEKAVELGVMSICPVITEHTVSKNILNISKIERLKKIIISAMGQSQRCVLPELQSTLTFKELLSKTGSKLNKIVMYESSDDCEKIDFSNNSNELSILIGPEGGFNENEISELRKNNWQVKSLGKRKLRAETAAIVSVFNFNSKFN